MGEILSRVIEMVNWKRIRNYERKEWVTDPDKVDDKLVLLVDSLTSVMKEQFGANTFGIIHVAYEVGGHAVGSQHYQGKAVDLHFVNVPLLEQFLWATRFPFNGVGVYPYWRRPGLHLDIRDSSTFVARWWKDQEGEYQPCDRNLIGLLVEMD